MTKASSVALSITPRFQLVFFLLFGRGGETRPAGTMLCNKVRAQTEKCKFCMCTYIQTGVRQGLADLPRVKK
jgi:hypothetical protein